MAIISLNNHPSFKPAPAEPVDKKKGKKKPKGYRKDGRVKRTYTDGVKPNGKPNIKYFYGKTIAEAEAARDAYINKIALGIDVSKENITVSEWIDEWMATYKSNLSAKSKENLSFHVNQVKNQIGKQCVVDVLPVHLQKIMNGLAGKSKSKVNYVHHILHDAFKKAVSNRIILSNPADDLIFPETTSGTHRSLEPWEIKLVLEQWRLHRFGLIVKAMMLTGMRPGEAIALRWEKIDMEKHQLTIDDAVEMLHNQPKHRGKTKTASGIRTLPMCDDLYEMLNETPKAARKGYVFLSVKGCQLSQSAMDRGMDGYFYVMERFLNGEDVTAQQTGRPHRHNLDKAKNDEQKKKWAEHNEKVDEWEASRRRMRFVPYDLRHTFCTAMYDAGVDIKTAAYFMGHRDIETTLHIYTHLSEDRNKKGAATMVDFLNSWSHLKQAGDEQNGSAFLLTGSKKGQTLENDPDDSVNE